MLFDILDLSLGSTLLGPSRFEPGRFRHEEVLCIMGLPLFCGYQPVLYLAVGAGAKLKSDKITGGGNSHNLLKYAAYKEGLC